MPTTRQVSGASAERRVRLHYRLRGYRVLGARLTRRQILGNSPDATYGLGGDARGLRDRLPQR